jgi:hypothetical protein
MLTNAETVAERSVPPRVLPAARVHWPTEVQGWVDRIGHAPLDRLASEANAAYRDSRTSMTKACHQALACGQALLKAKAQLPHGQFLPWLAKNFEGSQPQAWRYMKLAANYSHVNNFPSIRQALMALEEPCSIRQRHQIGAFDVALATARVVRVLAREVVRWPPGRRKDLASLLRDSAATLGADEAGPAVPRATEMSPAALVFLTDQVARQLAVAWVACKGDEAIWVANSGIRTSSHGNARQLCTALRTSGICRDGGITDDLALRYILTIVTRPLLKRMNAGR